MRGNCSKHWQSAPVLRCVVAIAATALWLPSCSTDSAPSKSQGPNSSWLDVSEDPVALGEWLLVNEIDETELAQLAVKPIAFHLALVDHVLELKSAPLRDRGGMLAELKADLDRRQGEFPVGTGATLPYGMTGASDQPVEYRAIVYGPTTAYQVRSWGSGNGMEYTFYFSPRWTDNPDDIRWASAVGWVTYCIWARSQFSGHGIAGHHLSQRPYQLQLGNGVMKLIGYGFRDAGVRATYASLYMHHR